MRAEVRWQRNGGAEAEEHAQHIHGHVDDWDAERVEEGRRQEVQQREEPPDADEERVVDDGVRAICRAGDIIAHECGDENGAGELLLCQ